MQNNKSSFSKKALNMINKKAGKQITEDQIKKLASGVKPAMMQNEAQLRQLIKQVASTVKLPVAEATINEIVKTIKKTGMNPTNLEKFIGFFVKK